MGEILNVYQIIVELSQKKHQTCPTKYVDKSTKQVPKKDFISTK